MQVCGDDLCDSTSPMVTLTVFNMTPTKHLDRFRDKE